MAKLSSCSDANPRIRRAHPRRSIALRAGAHLGVHPRGEIAGGGGVFRVGRPTCGSSLTSVPLCALDRLPVSASPREAFKDLIQPATERPRRRNSRPSLPYAIGQVSVGRHDREPGRRLIVRHHIYDFVIGGVAAAPGCEDHRDRAVNAGRHVPGLPVEHHDDLLAGLLRVPVELVDQPSNRLVGIDPPPVRTGADHVHAVHQPTCHFGDLAPRRPFSVAIPAVMKTISS